MSPLDPRVVPTPLKKADDVYDISNIDGLVFADFLIGNHGELLTLEAEVAAGMPSEFLLKEKSCEWVSNLGTANGNTAIAEAFETVATGLLKKYYRGQGLGPQESGNEAKIKLAPFAEAAKRWKKVADSLQERIWHAGRIMEALDKEYSSQ